MGILSRVLGNFLSHMLSLINPEDLFLQKIHNQPFRPVNGKYRGKNIYNDLLLKRIAKNQIANCEDDSFDQLLRYFLVTDISILFTLSLSDFCLSFHRIYITVLTSPQSSRMRSDAGAEELV